MICSKWFGTPEGRPMFSLFSSIVIQISVADDRCICAPTHAKLTFISNITNMCFSKANYLVNFLWQNFESENIVDIRAHFFFFCFSYFLFPVFLNYVFSVCYTNGRISIIGGRRGSSVQSGNIGQGVRGHWGQRTRGYRMPGFASEARGQKEIEESQVGC